MTKKTTTHINLIKMISSYITLKQKDEEILLNYFEPVAVKKNTLLEKENQKTQYLYFINNGFVRVFITDDGEEKTTQINCPSKFITSFQSFITGEKAIENVETITDCNLLKITKKNLDILNSTIENWNIFSEKIYEKAVLYNEERTRNMILLSAEERYLKLLKTQPEVIQNVPLQYIASYIGIKPESLSRIRKQIIS